MLCYMCSSKIVFICHYTRQNKIIFFIFLHSVCFYCKLCGNYGRKKNCLLKHLMKKNNNKSNDNTRPDSVKYLSISLNFCVGIFVYEVSNTVTSHEFIRPCLIFHSLFFSHLMCLWDKQCTLLFTNCSKLGS